jgi:hypothetical protein
VLSDVPHRLTGVELEQLSGAHHLGNGLGQRLALLAGEQVPQLPAAGEQFAAATAAWAWSASADA